MVRMAHPAREPLRESKLKDRSLRFIGIGLSGKAGNPSEDEWKQIDASGMTAVTLSLGHYASGGKNGSHRKRVASRSRRRARRSPQGSRETIWHAGEASVPRTSVPGANLAGRWAFGRASGSAEQDYLTRDARFRPKSFPRVGGTNFWPSGARPGLPGTGPYTSQPEYRHPSRGHWCLRNPG